MSRVLLSVPADFSRHIETLLSADAPVFLSRLGGSDTDLVQDFFRLAETVQEDTALAQLSAAIELVKRYNGYYDRQNDLANVVRYCQVMKAAYTGCPEVCLSGATWLTAYFPDSLNPKFHVALGPHKEQLERFLQLVSPQFLHLYPYTFIERILQGQTLFSVFARVLSGRRVMAVCPFERSICANFARRDGFFPDYVYPTFDLQTINTPITYAGLPDEFYPHANWFETLEALKAQLAQHDFDIALLACGSYAAPLGRFIADELQRKAVYVGGVLQLYFGIMGRRYEHPFFLDQINKGSFIYPLERDAVLRHVIIRPETATEALAAYF